jgi:hypothetical protein
MSEKKRSLGQFFTKKHTWYKNHIKDFFSSTQAETIIDPFAGAWDIFSIFPNYKHIGMDIDPTGWWEINDSLLSIPRIEWSCIVTNPPYLSNYSASRKGILENVSKYFDGTRYDDLYQRAIDCCLENNDYLIAILPEIYINSWRLSNRLVSLTVIEENIFDDTDCPICIGCFWKEISSEISIYKNDKYIGNMSYFNSLRPQYDKSIDIIFNSKNAYIWLRAVDWVYIDKPVQFLKKDELDYSMDNIKVSSRLMTFIDIPAITDIQKDHLIDEANNILRILREETHDIIFSPFKWNNKAGVRRRRLDYRTARAILEKSYKNLYIPQTNLF